jgi:hypothetical protein
VEVHRRAPRTEFHHDAQSHRNKLSSWRSHRRRRGGRKRRAQPRRIRLADVEFRDNYDVDVDVLRPAIFGAYGLLTQHERDGGRRYNFPAFPMAWALVHLAGGGAESAQTFSAAQSAARREWGQFFAPSAAPTG